MKDIIITERLYLRPWRDTDAAALYKYAGDDRVGPACGWTVHTSVEESLEVIRNILSAPETYAICDKTTDEPIGSIALMASSAPCSEEGDLEVGYWLGVPYWGRGLMPEAVKRILLYAFDELGVQKVWLSYFEGNEKSKRVADKCGFKFVVKVKDIDWPMLNTKKDINFTCITKEEFFK